MMKKIIVNLSGADSRRQIHDRLAESFGFPEWYGRNLDALYDCLTDITEDTCAGIYGWPEEAGLCRYAEKVRRAFEDAEEENRHLCVFFFPLESQEPEEMEE